jgi:hypothetical protein
MKCCPNDVFSSNIFRLSQNVSQFDFYRFLPASMNYNMIVSATQGTTSENIILTPQYPSGRLPGIQASLQFTVLNQQYFQTFDFENVVVPTNQISDGVLVPKIYFPPSISKTNIFNMQNVDFVTNKNCQLPLGYLVSIGGGTIYNQMSAFQTKVSDRIQCLFDSPTSSILPATASYRCTNIGTMTILLELDTGDTTIKLNRLYGDPFVTNSGMLPFSILDTQAIIFLDIMNKGLVEGVFQVSPKRCCLGTDCTRLQIQQAISLFVASMNTQRFSFFVMSSQVLNQKGFCDFEIFQHGNLSLTAKVVFEDMYTGVLPPGTNPGSSSCTYDQYFTTSCIFVDCVAKYLGKRSFPNVQTGYCESTPTCIAWKEVYDPLNNICIPIPGPSNTTNGPVHLVNCGSNGVLTPDKSTCTCNVGWTTSLTQSNFGNYQFCTIPTGNTSTPTATQDLAALEIGIVVFVLIVCVGLFCSFCACLMCLCRWMMKNKKKMDKEETQEFNTVDQQDDSIPEAISSNLDSEEFNLME